MVKRWIQGLYTLWKIASQSWRGGYRVRAHCEKLLVSRGEVGTGFVHIVENC